MNLLEAVTLFKKIPATAKDLIIYPNVPDTLFFSLTSGAEPPKDSGWGKARDIHPAEGLDRFKIIVAKDSPVV